MSSEPAGQSSSFSSAESSSNLSAPKEIKKIRPKTAKVKETKFRKTGFEEDEEIDDSPPAKKSAPIFPTFFHQNLLTNIPLFNNGSNLVIKNVDEKTSSNKFAAIDTTTSSVLPIDGKKKRKVRFADETGKKLVEVKYYDRYIYLLGESTLATTADANVRNQHLNEAKPLKNAFVCFKGSNEGVASTSQASAQAFASYPFSLSRSILNSSGFVYSMANKGGYEPIFASNLNPLFPSNSHIGITVSSPQLNGDLKYDRNDNKELHDPRNSNKKHFHQFYSPKRYERDDYRRESRRSHHHRRRRSPDEHRGRNRRGHSPDRYGRRNRHSPSRDKHQSSSRDYGSRGRSPVGYHQTRFACSPSPDKYQSRTRDYGSYKSYRQHSSRSPPSHSTSYEKKKKSHHSRTRKFSRSPSRERF